MSNARNLSKVFSLHTYVSQIISNALVAPGVVQDYAGAAAPSGYLMCYGQAVSRATYAALFDVIGTTFGAGDGSTTFNVPDCRGRVSAGKDDMGGAAAGRLTNSGTGNPGINGATLGATGGVDRHALTVAQMPSHSHDYPRTIAAAGGSGVAAPDGGTYSNTTAVGGNEAHPNVQPTIVFNKIIKT